MSFCCGASMIGSIGTLRHLGTRIHHVPLLFCPVCNRMEVHFAVATEYEILAEYAHGDGAEEVDFRDFMEEQEDLFANCVHDDTIEPLALACGQIDVALDLLSIAKYLQDEEWVAQLKQRLVVLNNKRMKWLQNASSAGSGQ